MDRDPGRQPGRWTTRQNRYHENPSSDDGFSWYHHLHDRSAIAARTPSTSIRIQPALVEGAARFEPFGSIVQEQPARGGGREYAAGRRCRSAGDGPAEVHEAPFS